MIIGLDFDGVITKRPLLFANLVDEFQKYKDSVIVVTNRKDSLHNRNQVGSILGAFNINVTEVLYTNGVPKREAARALGYEVDIWIDDNPILVDFGIDGYMKLYEKDPSAIKG